MNSSDISVKERIAGRLSRLKTFASFTVWGWPGFISAIILNYAFVEFLQINVYVAYVYVLLLITVFNFFVVDKIVFSMKDKRFNGVNRFVRFSVITLSSRAVEWGLYSLIIYVFNLYFIFTQVIISSIFVIVKYKVLKRWMI